MTLQQRLNEMRSGFSRTFWVANTLELFERLAYYGSKAVLVKFLAEKVGFHDEAATLAGLFNFVLYFLPALAGVFVDKYGFKRTLMACFAIFCVGYFLIGLAGMAYGAAIAEAVGKKAYMLGVLLLTAVGGSLIKPCIVGTVTHTSKPETRALGFSIYYSLVNLGGAIGPVIAYSVRSELGIEYVLIMSSVTSLLLFFGALFFFKEPEGTTERKSFSQVLGNMMMVFANIKFMSFLVIFSGFWIMFWQLFYTLPFYSTDVLKYEAYELLETVDAWCIILLTIPVTALVSKWKPIVAVTLGLAIASASWIVIGAGGNMTWCIIGIGLFAFGEAMQAPRFYEYVSLLAPKDQIGTFMGFAFLPIAIGTLTAGVLSDYLRINYLATKPAMMWYILAMIGLATTVLMLIYNKLVSR